jgi:hypothetical protein
LVTKRVVLFVAMAVIVLLSFSMPAAMAFAGDKVAYSKAPDYQSTLVGFDLADVPAMKLDNRMRSGVTDTAFGGDGSYREYIKKMPVSKNFNPAFYKHYVGSHKKHKDRPGWV